MSIKSIDTQHLSDIANAIRKKTNRADDIAVSDMAKEIRSITAEGGLPVLSNEGSAEDILLGKEFLDGEGNVIIGTIPSQTEDSIDVNGATITVPAGHYAEQTIKTIPAVDQGTPDITISSQGLITASVSQTGGYVKQGTSAKTKQLPTQDAKIITPSTANKIAVNSGVYTTGTISVAGDANLKAENIAAGISIFGIQGRHSGGVDTSDATATATDILEGETAYVDGKKVIGTIPIKTASDLTVSGATVTVPSGYYDSQVNKSVTTVTQATPNITIDSNGLITASASQDAGYVTSGIKTSTKQLDTQSAKTITPSRSSQTAALGGVYTTGDITVAAIPDEYVELPGLENEGSASDLLSGKELIDADGNVVTGTIATKTSSDLTANGATVTVPTGYYATQATKSVATAARAETTMTTTADDTNDKLTITASNNQTTGYVTGENKTATKTVTLTVSGNTVTASDGSKSISKSVATVTQATPSISVNSSGLITASATQSEGYVAAGTKSGTKQLTTQAAKTITPSKSSQTAVAKDVYTTGVITVEAIPDDYITTTDATATSSDILSGKTAYVDGEKVTGTIATKTSSNLTASGATVTVPSGYYATQATKSVATATQATPNVSVNSSGLITATATQTAGYVAAGSKSGTKQLTTQSAKTITPTTSSQTAVAKDVYTTGVVTVAAIPSQYITTTDATASADEIMSGETAYVNGSKVTGTFTIDNELTAQDNLISQIQTALQGKAGGSAEPVLQTKTVTPTTSTQNIIPDSNYDGLSKVTVNPIPSNYIVPSGTKTITTNGTHDVKAYASATVNVAGEDVTTETSAYTTKLATLETAITALETELQGKASGGSGGGNIETCTVTINNASQTVICSYTDAANMTLRTCQGSNSITVPRNTLIFAKESNYCNFLVSGDCGIEYNNYVVASIWVHGDCTITANVRTESGGA